MNASSSSASAVELGAYQDHLRHYLRKAALKAGVPGVALEVNARGHRLQATAGVQAIDAPVPMSPATRFPIGKVCYSLLSVPFMELHCAGHLNFETPLADCVPELKGCPVGTHVQLRHLLTHSGGHRSFGLSGTRIRQDFNWQDLVAFLRTSDVVFEPGTMFSYSPAAAPLLAEILLRVTGLDLMQATRELCFEPGATIDWNRDEPLVHVRNRQATRRAAAPPSYRLGPLWRSAGLELMMSPGELLTILRRRIELLRGNPDIQGRYENPSLLRLPAMLGLRAAEDFPVAAALGGFFFDQGWLGCDAISSTQSCSFRYRADLDMAAVLCMNLQHPPTSQIILGEVLASVSGCARANARACDWPAQSLAGEYVGLAGGEAVVTETDTGLTCVTRSAIDGRESRVVLCRDDAGWSFGEGPKDLPVGFIASPMTNQPCLLADDKLYCPRANPVFAKA